MPKGEHLYGTLDMLVLKVLARGPMHGYGVARQIQRSSDEVLKIEEGSLYPALYRMERRGWIEWEWGPSETNRRAKYYRLTRAGRRQLEAEASSWAVFSRAVGRVMGTA
jgi:transcriptional regulator